MKTKFKDELYCGVNKNIIAKAKPVIIWKTMKYFHHYLIERYNIHKKKDVQGIPKPWTTDKVLLKYKFTNVRREHDRQSVYLIKGIVENSHLDLKEKILNILLFRFWNNWDTMKDLGGPWKLSELTSLEVITTIQDRYKSLVQASPKRLWFSSAYNQGGTKQAWKTSKTEASYNLEDIPLRAFNMVKYVIDNNLVNTILFAENQKDCFEAIKLIPGYANFLAYQVFVDCTYIEEFPFSENEFVIAGPGCINGLNSLFDKPIDMTYEELLFWFRDNLLSIFCAVELESDEKYIPNELYSDLPVEDRCMNIMSLENCMCEFSKYIRTINGVGRPRVKYEGE